MASAAVETVAQLASRGAKSVDPAYLAKLSAADILTLPPDRLGRLSHAQV